jgi:hypothetical protein
LIRQFVASGFLLHPVQRSTVRRTERLSPSSRARLIAKPVDA